MRSGSRPTRTSPLLLSTSKREKGIADADLIDRMVLRMVHCRELADWLADERAAGILRQMANEIEADIRRIRAQRVERRAIPLKPE